MDGVSEKVSSFPARILRRGLRTPWGKLSKLSGSVLKIYHSIRLNLVYIFYLNVVLKFLFILNFLLAMSIVAIFIVYILSF